MRMLPHGIGLPEMIILFIIALIVFGPRLLRRPPRGPL